jgi:hypothetical protein
MNEKVNWIIEKYLFEEYEDKLIQSIKDCGMNVDIYDDTMSRFDNIQDYIKNKYTEQDIIIMHGSLQMGRRMLRTFAYPGVFLTLENYECYNYYGYFGDHLLNSEYVMMGLNDVLRNTNKVFDIFGTDKLFIRPSNGYKSFTGQCLSKDTFDEDFNILIKSYGGLDMNTLVVLAPSKEIEEEYRFIVINGEVISGAQYMDTDTRTEWKAQYDKPCNNRLATFFAKRMVKLYQPDKAYTIDVCKTKEGKYKLIEINSFCCASWYGNDIPKVVEAVNNLCIYEYNEIYE